MKNKTRKLNKKRKSRKGGMFNVKNFDKSCRDNHKDFDRGKTLGYVNRAAPYNPTTYYPGVFNSNKSPVKNIMNCNGSYSTYNESPDKEKCRQARRELFKYERATNLVVNQLYASMDTNSIENCNKIIYYLCTRFDPENDGWVDRWGVKVLVTISHDSRQRNIFSYTIDYAYYDANIPPSPQPKAPSQSIWDRWSNTPAPVQVPVVTVPIYRNIHGEPMLTPSGNPIYEISLDNLELYIAN